MTHASVFKQEKFALFEELETKKEMIIKRKLNVHMR